mmetsp:Transcript_57537/g.178689  ORF Transcript_57537/g.178689 Transcript_57537/m.178689 type:complete len:246 (-) Transcript_57537:263-1000(-)
MCRCCARCCTSRAWSALPASAQAGPRRMRGWPLGPSAVPCSPGSGVCCWVSSRMLLALRRPQLQVMWPAACVALQRQSRQPASHGNARLQISLPRCQFAPRSWSSSWKVVQRARRGLMLARRSSAPPCARRAWSVRWRRWPLPWSRSASRGSRPQQHWKSGYGRWRRQRAPSRRRMCRGCRTSFAACVRDWQNMRGGRVCPRSPCRSWPRALRSRRTSQSSRRCGRRLPPTRRLPPPGWTVWSED